VLPLITAASEDLKKLKKLDSGINRDKIPIIFSLIAPFLVKTTLPRPLADSPVPAGFPSPAEDYSGRSFDLNDFIEHPSAIFFSGSPAIRSIATRPSCHRPFHNDGCAVARSNDYVE
jgi:hypothetical protein